MKIIPLTQGQVALVDDADFEAVNAHKWCASKTGRHGAYYAVRSFRKPDGTWTTQALHQFLMPDIARVDHRDGNRLNNQRHNLRPSTHQQNMMAFQVKQIGRSSRFRGVSWHRKGKKWCAQIKVNGQTIYLGIFKIEKEAALARDAAAIKYHGEFASLNFPKK